MKCKKCGSDNTDNAKYCSNCGEQLTLKTNSEMNDILSDLDNIINESSSTSKQNNVELNGVRDISDNELINRLNRAQVVLKEAYVYFSEAAAIQRNVNLNKYEVDSKKYVKFIVVEVIKILIFSMILLKLINNSGMFLLEILVVVAYIGIPFYMLYKLYSLYKMYVKDKQQITNTQLQKINDLNTKGTAILKSNVDVLNVVPDNYWMPEAVRNIISSLQTGRASDLKEALDICDQYLIKVSNDQIRNQLQASEIEIANQLNIIKTLIIWR